MNEIINRIKAEGKNESENRMALLIKKLIELSRIDDLKKASENKEYRHRLMKEFFIR